MKKLEAIVLEKLASGGFDEIQEKLSEDMPKDASFTAMIVAADYMGGYGDEDPDKHQWKESVKSYGGHEPSEAEIEDLRQALKGAAVTYGGQYNTTDYFAATVEDRSPNGLFCIIGAGIIGPGTEDAWVDSDDVMECIDGVFEDISSDDLATDCEIEEGSEEDDFEGEVKVQYCNGEVIYYPEDFGEEEDPEDFED